LRRMRVGEPGSQAAVIGVGGDDVFHALAGNAARNQRAHQHARDGSAAVGKMKDVRLFFFAAGSGITIQLHSTKSGVPDAVVVAGAVAVERWNGIDADCPQVVRAGLKEGENVFVYFDDLGEEVSVTGLGQSGEFLFARKAGKIIHFLRVRACDIAPGCRGKGSLGKKSGPRQLSHARDEAIFAERFPVKERAGLQLHGRIQLLIVGLVELPGIDAEIFLHSFGHVAIARRALDRLSAAIAQQKSATCAKLVALGVPAKVIVVVEDQDARAVPRRLAIEVRGGKSADASAHHNQVIGFPVGSGPGAAGENFPSRSLCAKVKVPSWFPLIPISAGG
jgi:hypothetical protein